MLFKAQGVDQLEELHQRQVDHREGISGDEEGAPEAQGDPNTLGRDEQVRDWRRARDEITNSRERRSGGCKSDEN